MTEALKDTPEQIAAAITADALKDGVDLSESEQELVDSIKEMRAGKCGRQTIFSDDSGKMVQIAVLEDGQPLGDTGGLAVVEIQRMVAERNARWQQAQQLAEDFKGDTLNAMPQRIGAGGLVLDRAPTLEYHGLVTTIVTDPVTNISRRLMSTHDAECVVKFTNVAIETRSNMSPAEWLKCHRRIGLFPAPRQPWGLPSRFATRFIGYGHTWEYRMHTLALLPSNVRPDGMIVKSRYILAFHPTSPKSINQVVQALLKVRAPK